MIFELIISLILDLHIQSSYVPKKTFSHLFYKNGKLIHIPRKPSLADVFGRFFNRTELHLKEVKHGL